MGLPKEVVDAVVGSWNVGGSQVVCDPNFFTLLSYEAVFDFYAEQLGRAVVGLGPGMPSAVFEPAFLMGVSFPNERHVAYGVLDERPAPGSGRPRFVVRRVVWRQADDQARVRRLSAAGRRELLRSWPSVEADTVLVEGNGARAVSDMLSCAREALAEPSPVSAEGGVEYARWADVFLSARGPARLCWSRPAVSPVLEGLVFGLMARIDAVVGRGGAEVAGMRLEYEAPPEEYVRACLGSGFLPDAALRPVERARAGRVEVSGPTGPFGARRAVRSEARSLARLAVRTSGGDFVGCEQVARVGLPLPDGGFAWYTAFSDNRERPGEDGVLVVRKVEWPAAFGRGSLPVARGVVLPCGRKSRVADAVGLLGRAILAAPPLPSVAETGRGWGEAMRRFDWGEVSLPVCSGDGALAAAARAVAVAVDEVLAAASAVPGSVLLDYTLPLERLAELWLGELED